MHSLDINFLNDRPEYKPDGASRARARGGAAVSDSRQPLILGGIAALLLPALAGGLLLFLQSRNADLEQRQAALDSQLGDLQNKQKQIDSIKTETKQVKDETQALASVFNQLKPWSAVMQDFRDRIPPGVQILEVKQIAPPPGQPQPAPSPQQPNAPPVPTTKIEIKGLAKTFGDVNDFMLVLQRSSFLDPRVTQLVSSELQQQAPTLTNVPLRNVASQTSVNSRDLPKLPKQVEFTIQTAFNDVPASELLPELERKTAVGLVTRIEALQRKGVIQK